MVCGATHVGYFEFGWVHRSKKAYNALISRTQAQGYTVYTFQLPLIVDVRGDDESVMIFSGFNRSVGAALIWALGPDAQSITIGCRALSGNPLSWEKFCRDVIVASHFSRIVGV